MGMLELENQFLAPHPKGTDVWHSLPKTNQRSESPKSKLRGAATAFEISKVWEQIILVMRGSGCVYCLSPILSVTWSSWIILLWTRTDSLTLPELCSSSPVKCKTDSSTLGNVVCSLEVQSKEASTFCLVLFPLLFSSQEMVFSMNTCLLPLCSGLRLLFPKHLLSDNHFARDLFVPIIQMENNSESWIRGLAGGNQQGYHLSLGRSV